MSDWCFQPQMNQFYSDPYLKDDRNAVLSASKLSNTHDIDPSASIVEIPNIYIYIYIISAKPERLPVPKAGLRQKHFHGNIHCPICVLKYHFQKNKQTSFHICKFIPQNAYGAPTIGKF